MAKVDGAAKMIGYYSNDLYRLAFQFDFAIGILCALLAGLLAFLPQRVLPTLPVLLSVYVILDALLKLHRHDQMLVNADDFSESFAGGASADRRVERECLTAMALSM